MSRYISVFLNTITRLITNRKTSNLPMKKISTLNQPMTTTAIRREPVAQSPRPEILANLRRFARAYRPFGTSFPGMILN